ncbi:hypothetical protein [Sphingomonas sp. C3-2]|uniref:hypothetical protein n=1 Tax=Sphingomonas sp. C3-2 TaxID=3062169 RepID=UPI00294ABAE7|nr:hypothetical protein [Sphingomonas sp. C3-2]WOK36706.1 hypothetical protein QYC26_00440 [Sphingomonas sp. C3-2]
MSDLQGTLFEQVSLDSGEDWPVFTADNMGPHYRMARHRAVRSLAGSQNRISVHLVLGQSLTDVLSTLSARDQRNDVHHIGMAYIDYSDPHHTVRSISDIDLELQGFYTQLRAMNLHAFQTPTSTIVFQSAERAPYQIQPLNFIRREMPADPDLLRAQWLSLWMDFYELSVTNRQIHPGDCRRPVSAMATTLAHFLEERVGANWALQYYTGSLVSSLISAFEDLAEQRNIPVLRGPSEHALACGAMANWQLYDKPSVTIVTAGMIDEFRGTLANLCEARARGFIICAEQPPARWYAFQATINPELDGCEVLRARRIPFVFIHAPEDLPNGLAEALRLYDEDRGPVVILATQSVMNVAEVTLPEPNNVSCYAPHDEPRDALDRLIALFNEGPERILLLPGKIGPPTRALLAEIAERSGIALADSIIHPGMAASHIEGRLNPAYLGTLGVYGISDAVYRFLHRDRRIAPRDEQALVFLGDKISQAVTPFGEGKLQRMFHIAQVVAAPSHIAPFADIAVIRDPHAALAQIRERLNVSDDLLARRKAAIAAAHLGEEDLSGCLPVLPMTPNYFFKNLGTLLRDMIEQDNYDFTGVYDVGRCGISAIRNLPKTRAGFSGWFGRALMGDAYMATVALAQTAPTDLLVFVGDGARALAPDILPSLLENALSNGAHRDLSISIFVLINNGFSAINTYQERILFNRTSRQMRLLSLGVPASERDLCGYRVVTRTIDHLDTDAMRDDLRARGRINLFTVNLTHNNEGDGMSLAHVSGWQQDQLARSHGRPGRAHAEERF